ncbi:hypothetical protein PR048_013919 [Dryococelus australis]|uniref:Transposase n=1 Tax=Dryococelus australis TaxID=614101 RepID=A0ABQ9HTK2_9NEOP|nr:hypothetical protein PR048_013919 [Dryococelus australis]
MYLIRWATAWLVSYQALIGERRFDMLMANDAILEACTTGNRRISGCFTSCKGVVVDLLSFALMAKGHSGRHLVGGSGVRAPIPPRQIFQFAYRAHVCCEFVIKSSPVGTRRLPYLELHSRVFVSPINMVEYTFAEYTDMILVYGAAECDGRAAGRLYQERYQQRATPSHTIFATITNDCGAPKRRRTPELEEAVLHHVEQSPSTSMLSVGRSMGVTSSIVWEVLHEQQLHPYHLQRVQSLHPADFARLNVRCGIIDDQLIGTVFVDNRLNGERYLHIRQKVLTETQRKRTKSDGLFAEMFADKTFKFAVTYPIIEIVSLKQTVVFGAAVAEQLACSPPTKANPVPSPAGSHRDFRMWESCRTMPLAGGFSRGSPVSSALSFRHCSILTSITLIGSQDDAVKSGPNLSKPPAWYADKNVRRMDWLAQSPDLSHIEYLWDELDRQERASQARPKSIAQLMEWCQEE